MAFRLGHGLRIKARAVRRAGELLKDFDARGDHRKSGDAPTSSQREAAEAAGLSKDQQVQAVRVANIPAPEFELQVESANPPTITALAEQGTKQKADTGGLISQRAPAWRNLTGVAKANISLERCVSQPPLSGIKSG
jgi:hypothetical protein